jgi:primosomal protein N' (replication factor Y)
MTYYYEVFPLAIGFAGQVLTYASEDILAPGTSVRINVRSKSSNALIYRRVSKPHFTTKSIDGVLDEPALPAHLIALSEWMASYYAVPISLVVRSMVPRGLGKKRRVLSNQTPRQKQRSQIAMNEPQQAALDKIENTTKTVWLHGTTGSGKTRIYVELADRVNSQGKDCILLVPEISLTPQLLDQFKTLSSSNEIYVVHSGLTESQRHSLWRKVANATEPVILIGPRSTLFMPVRNIGLVIIDEAHDQSYHQDQQPRYNALRVGSYLASLTNAQLIMGSATPPIDEMYFAQQKDLTLVRLPDPVFPRAQQITPINLSDKTLFTRNRWLSNQLLESIARNLEQKNKTLLLLNLRGTRQTIFCANCGWFAECPNCLMPLKYHHDNHTYRCHVCDYHESAVVACPSCKQPELTYRGIGTKQLEIDLQKLFPGLRVVRYDRDSTSVSVSHDDIYQQMLDTRTQVIIGTQLVGKGLDIPRLTTVGIIHADTSLQVPDYSSHERTFQMIYQVAGRAGRQGEASEVFVQSFIPSHPAISYAMQRDYGHFYEQELQIRKVAQLPPFVFLAKLIGQFSSLKQAEHKSAELAKKLALNVDIHVLGPAPAYHEYFRGKYHWQIILKSKHRKALTEAIKDLPATWSFSLDPSTLL